MSLNFGEFVAVGSMSAAVNMVDDACGGRRATLIASVGGWESLPQEPRQIRRDDERTPGRWAQGSFSWASCQTPEFW